MNKGYLSVIETLGNAIISKDLELSVLKYENEKLEAKIKSIEEHISSYESICEDVNKGE